MITIPLKLRWRRQRPSPILIGSMLLMFLSGWRMLLLIITGFPSDVKIMTSVAEDHGASKQWWSAYTAAATAQNHRESGVCFHVLPCVAGSSRCYCLAESQLLLLLWFLLLLCLFLPQGSSPQQQRRKFYSPALLCSLVCKHSSLSGASLQPARKPISLAEPVKLCRRCRFLHAPLQPDCLSSGRCVI